MFGFLKKLFGGGGEKERPVHRQGTTGKAAKAGGGAPDSPEAMAARLQAVMAAVYDHDDSPESLANAAKDLTDLYENRGRSQDGNSKVVQALQEFLRPRHRTLFFPNAPLAAAARSLTDCGDESEIREWAVDLLGRVGEDSDVAKIVTMATKDANPRVRQEATAALGKYVRFRPNVPDEVAKSMLPVCFNDEEDEKVTEAQKMLVVALAERDRKLGR